MTERAFYKSIEGCDKEGSPNAMCSLIILGPDEHGEPVSLGEATSFTGIVYPAIVPGGLSMIDVLFDDPLDYDYMHMVGVCEQFTKMVMAANANGSEMPSLILTVSEQGVLSKIMSCTNCAWSYIVAGAGQTVSGIRFIIDTKNIHFMEFDDDQLEKVFDELDEENMTEDAEIANILKMNREQVTSVIHTFDGKAVTDEMPQG